MPVDNNIFRKFLEKEISTMSLFLTSKVNKTSLTIDEYIDARLLQGADLDIIQEDLLKDLEEGGRIFGEFRSAIKSTVKGTVNRSRDNAIFSTIGIDTKYRWVAVLVNTCPDCLDRHNKIKTWDEWEAEGLPRTGQTVCKENCKCVLLPAENTEVEPIIRK
jgi:hypothetical protein